MKFVFDIDGTICFDGKTIEPAIIEALEQLVAAKHEVIFASARPIRDLVPVLPSTFRKNLLVGGNGCFISKDGHIEAHYFERDLLEQLVSIIETYQLTFLADGEWDYCFTGETTHPIYKNIDQTSAKHCELYDLHKVCKLVLFQPTEHVITALSMLPVNVTFYKNEHAIDISPFGIDKVKGLQRLQVHDFIAFGNDNNDQCLFEHAIYSVCVGTNDVRQFATKQISREEVSQTIVNTLNNLEEILHVSS